MRDNAVINWKVEAEKRNHDQYLQKKQRYALFQKELRDALTDSSQWTECSALDASPFFVSDAAGGLNGTSTAASTSAAAAGVVGAAAVVAMW